MNLKGLVLYEVYTYYTSGSIVQITGENKYWQYGSTGQL